MLVFIKTDSSNTDFIRLVELLDLELRTRDGDLNSFYHQYNGIENLKHVVVAYENKIPIACGAMKIFSPGIMEIKRMYTLPAFRGKGIASLLLGELEKWAINLSIGSCILETGLGQPEAIRLYQKNGYHLIPNFDPYVGVENSRCFEKKLSE